jgi:uncharacterized protein YraI
MKKIVLLPLLLLGADWPGTGAWLGLWELQSSAYSYAAGRNGKTCVAVYDDSSGTLYTYNGTVQIRCASIIKVGIMAAVLNKAAQEGRWLTTWEAGQIEPMIRWSDNDAATNLWNYVGPQNVIAYLQSIGMSNTGFEPGLPLSWWGHTLTTAKDMTLLVAKLYYQQIATPQLCAWAIHVMTQVVSSQAWGLKGGVPSGEWVAWKNGWYPESTVWRVHSIGVVKAWNGKTYVMSVLTRYDVGLGQSYGIDTIQTISSQIYQTIAGSGPVATASAMQVTTSTLNVRSGPGTGYSILGTIAQGQVYIRIAEQNGWSKIYYAGNVGWCYSGYLQKLTGVTAVKVTTGALNVRTGPGTGYTVAGQVYQDQLYFWTQYEGLNGWYKIWWKGGAYYVYGGYVTKVPL